MEELEQKIKDVTKELEDLKIHVGMTKKLANDLNLPGKVAEVIRDFGTHDYDGESNYRSDTLSIYMQRSYIRVKVGGYAVLECALHDNMKGEIDLYKPGAWEIEIENLHKQIPTRKLQLRLASQENELHRLKQQWGIK